jgi:hypothetical protein
MQKYQKPSSARKSVKGRVMEREKEKKEWAKAN